jgi:hypothetical protein
MGAQAAGQEKQSTSDKPWLKCGEVGTYSQLKEKRAKPKFERDHVPSHAAMNRAAQKSPAGRGMSDRQGKCVKDRIKDQALTIAIPKAVHRKQSRTCGSKNDKKQISKDAGGLNTATKKDLDKIQKHLDDTESPCAAHYKAAAAQVAAQDHEALIKKVIKDCKAAYD